MGYAVLGVAVPLLGCLLSAASSTRPECSIMQEIEEERSQCFADLDKDNQTSGCRRQWDNITCWPEAEVGEVVVRSCPKYFRFLTTVLGNVTRNCTSQGWTDVYPAPYAVACGYDSNSTPGEEVCKPGRVDIKIYQGPISESHDLPMTNFSHSHSDSLRRKVPREDPWKQRSNVQSKSRPSLCFPGGWQENGI